jgi:transcriptional regulator with GAF, ATPase, and Fis domain
VYRLLSFLFWTIKADALKRHSLPLPYLLPAVSGAFGKLWSLERKDNSFSEHDAEFLTELAGQVAIAIGNALAYREISELKAKFAQESCISKKRFAAS